MLIWVSEPAKETEYSLMYYFDSSMRCARVDAHDEFVKFHKRLEAESKLKRVLDAQYFEELRRGVEYWDGEKFVNEPVMNKRYAEAVKKPLASR
jgi:acetyl-CoA carboxylase beta subunit